MSHPCSLGLRSQASEGCQVHALKQVSPVPGHFPAQVPVMLLVAGNKVTILFASFKVHHESDTSLIMQQILLRG